MHGDETAINRISECVTGCAFGEMNKLGRGFLEKVYENALAPAVLNADESQLQSLPGWLPFGARRVW
jgi:NAD(P)H-hydrate repair Nnr-like enzyme with NAD(P)H-hydrate dehydratase domain